MKVWYIGDVWGTFGEVVDQMKQRGRELFLLYIQVNITSLGTFCLKHFWGGSQNSLEYYPYKFFWE